MPNYELTTTAEKPEDVRTIRVFAESEKKPLPEYRKANESKNILRLMLKDK